MSRKVAEIHIKFCNHMKQDCGVHRANKMNFHCFDCGASAMKAEIERVIGNIIAGYATLGVWTEREDVFIQEIVMVIKSCEVK